MATSQARIDANRLNAARSTGPSSESGRRISRANSFKHGMTGAGVVLPEADAAEVERRSAAFAEELHAAGEVGLALARRAALNSVRMERGADRQTAALSERVRRAGAEFVPPEGADAAEVDRLRAEAGRVAMFDPSREATLARQYEAAAERGFLRCLKELRQMERQARAEAKAASPPDFEAMMGSFPDPGMTDEEFDTLYAELNIPLPNRPRSSAHLPQRADGVDVPISASRRR